MINKLLTTRMGYHELKLAFKWLTDRLPAA